MQKSQIIYNKKLKMKAIIVGGSAWKYMDVYDRIIITKEEKEKYSAGYSMTASDHGQKGKRYSNVIQSNGDTHFIRRS